MSDKKTISKIKYSAKELKPIQHIDELSSREFLINRIAELADKYGFIYKEVSIRNQKTRWGSCSMNNIGLNIQLIGLPHKLIDYVI